MCEALEALKSEQWIVIEITISILTTPAYILLFLFTIDHIFSRFFNVLAVATGKWDIVLHTEKNQKTVPVVFVKENPWCFLA